MDLDFFSNFRFDMTYTVFCIITVISIVIFLLNKRVKKFETLNPPPAIKPIFPKNEALIKRVPIEIKVGLFIDDFVVFDIIKNDFILDAYVWFSFNPSLIELSIIDQFSFDRSQLLIKSKPDTKLCGEMVFVRYKVRLRFSSDLDFHFFPLDTHRLYINLSNELITPEEAIFSFTGTSLRISDDFFLSEWNLIDTGIETGYTTKLLDPLNENSQISFPTVSFSLDFAHKGIRRSLVIVLPIILIYFIGFTALIFKQMEFGTVLGLTTGSFTGLLAYKFVIEKLSPNVGYFTLGDYIFTLFLAFSFVNFLLNIYLNINKESNHFIEMVRMSAVIIIPVILMALLIYVFRKHVKRA